MKAKVVCLIVAVVAVVLFMSDVIAPSIVFAAEGTLSSLKFKDTEVATVLKAIEKKAEQEGKKIHIVTTPEVFGLVTVDLEGVDWKTAMKVILKMYDLGYTQEGNILTVSTLEKIQGDQKKEDEALFSSGGVRIEAFRLKHVEANDAKVLVQPFLSKEGKISVLDYSSSRGWAFSTDTTGSVQAASSYGGTTQVTTSTPGQNSAQRMTRTKILVVSDTPPIVRQIGKLIQEVDIPPKQIFIKATLLEVNLDKVRDLGLDFGTGANGASMSHPRPNALNSPGGDPSMMSASASRFNKITPAVFNPLENTSTSSVNPYTTGFEYVFQKVRGYQFEVILHALEEDADTNTLSSPTLLTVDNQEASILVGTQYPIIETDSSTYSNNVVGGTLSEYKNIGIQLRVIPQIVGENEDMVNLIVHPIVSSYNDTVKVFGATAAAADLPIAQYPIILTREAETQMIVGDGETVVMGGLLQDQKRKEVMGVPYLRKIPLVGPLFDRNTNDKAKLDLLIFLTVKIVRPVDVMPTDVIGRQEVDQKMQVTKKS